jgi:tetratricopeptide (TPR) repeat protein
MRTIEPSGPAYEVFLQGNRWAALRSIDGYERSGLAFAQALELDPDFAPAHLARARRYLALAGNALMPAREAMPLCRQHAARALAIDPSLTEAHAIAGVVATTYDYEWEEGATHFRLALAGRPVPSARFRYAIYYLLPMRRFDEAIQQMDEGLRDDPLNALQRCNLAICLAAAGRMEASAQRLRDVLEINSSFWIASLVQAANATANGDLTGALEAAERAHVAGHWTPRTTGLLAGLASRAGDGRRASDLLEHLSDCDECGAPAGMVDYHLVRGEIDAARDWAMMAIAGRDPALPIALQHPYAAALRGAAHWPAVAAAMRLPS